MGFVEFRHEISEKLQLLEPLFLKRGLNPDDVLNLDPQILVEIEDEFFQITGLNLGEIECSYEADEYSEDFKLWKGLYNYFHKILCDIEFHLDEDYNGLKELSIYLYDEKDVELIEQSVKKIKCEIESNEFIIILKLLDQNDNIINRKIIKISDLKCEVQHPLQSGPE